MAILQKPKHEGRRPRMFLVDLLKVFLCYLPDAVVALCMLSQTCKQDQRSNTNRSYQQKTRANPLGISIHHERDDYRRRHHHEPHHQHHQHASIINITTSLSWFGHGLIDRRTWWRRGCDHETRLSINTDTSNNSRNNNNNSNTSSSSTTATTHHYHHVHHNSRCQ